MRRIIVSLFAIPLLCAAALPPVVDAAKQRDTAALRQLLERHVDVNAAAPDGGTALHWAAYHDEIAMAELLIKAGANVNAPNRYGVKPISIAASNGSSRMIELLLNAKADPEAAMGDGETVLMTAARSGNPDAVKLLIAHGAKVNAKEAWRGQTPLMWAAAEGHRAAVETLIAAGAEINARSKNGFTPFLFAAREGRQEVVAALLKAGVSANEALPTSARRGGAGAAHGSTALMLAVSNAHFELASKLLDAGADPNEGVQGWTALHLISDVRKPGTGSNDPAPPGSGSMNSLELVRRLVAHGAKIDARTARSRNVGLTSLNTEGATPFLLACRTDDVELMRLLVSLGADATIPNAEKTTPVLVAAGVGARSPGEDAGTEAEALAAVKYLVEELKADVNAVDERNDTSMHGVAYKHLPSVAQYLVEHGTKVDVWNIKNRNGWTPLRIAVGVHRGMNLRQSPETAAVLEKVMTAAGLSTAVEPEAVISGNTK
ncbi:MAG: ankyrin repeat domain-containing protein [Candidatus Solibacter sp.]